MKASLILRCFQIKYKYINNQILYKNVFTRLGHAEQTEFYSLPTRKQETVFLSTLVIIKYYILLLYSYYQLLVLTLLYLIRCYNAICTLMLLSHNGLESDVHMLMPC